MVGAVVYGSMKSEHREASQNTGLRRFLMEFPEPVIELAIEPKTKAGQGKMGEALAKLAEEDPTFRAHTNQETGQTIISHCRPNRFP